MNVLVEIKCHGNLHFTNAGITEIRMYNVYCIINIYYILDTFISENKCTMYRISIYLFTY